MMNDVFTAKYDDDVFTLIQDKMRDVFKAIDVLNGDVMHVSEFSDSTKTNLAVEARLGNIQRDRKRIRVYVNADKNDDITSISMRYGYDVPYAGELVKSLGGFTDAKRDNDAKTKRNCIIHAKDGQEYQIKCDSLSRFIAYTADMKHTLADILAKRVDETVEAVADESVTA